MGVCARGRKAAKQAQATHSRSSSFGERFRPAVNRSSPYLGASTIQSWPRAAPPRRFLRAENEQEDFLLSSYDATCSMTPAAARGLLRGDAAQPMRFTARYLCMGQMPAVVEAEVAQERLRLAPAGSSPFAVFGGG